MPARLADICITSRSISPSSTLRLLSMLSNSRGSKLSPWTARACWRACSKASRNSFWSISSRCHSIVTGHHDGADCHHFGGASTLAENVWFCWNRYCSMPKKANGMHSNPRITMAIQPEVFSRSFCSIGQECRDEAGQFTRNGSGGPHAARRHASAQEKGLLPNEETADPEREWAPGADALGATPPAPACGRRLLLDFAPRASAPGVPPFPVLQSTKAESPAFRQACDQVGAECDRKDHCATRQTKKEGTVSGALFDNWRSGRDSNPRPPACQASILDRKSTRLIQSLMRISYAAF